MGSCNSLASVSNLTDIVDEHCRLIKEAAIHSKQSGERSLAVRSVKKVTRVWTYLSGKRRALNL